MIFFTAKFFYFLLVFAFLTIVGISLLSGEDIFSHNIIYIFTVLLIPFFDMCIEDLKSESDKQIWRLNGKSFLKYILVLIVFIIAYKKGLDVLSLLVLVFFVFGIVFQMNSKIAFYLSLFCFSYVGVYLVIGEEDLSEQLSVYAYYMLIIGVVLQIRQSILDRKNITGE